MARVILKVAMDCRDNDDEGRDFFPNNSLFSELDQSFWTVPTCLNTNVTLGFIYSTVKRRFYFCGYVKESPQIMPDGSLEIRITILDIESYGRTA